MRGRGFVVAAAAAMLVWPCAASAQEVTGLTATQDYGFTTLKWNPVAGATDYQIERTPVDANDVPTGAAAIVGVWQPQRTITPAAPSFAESGYALGGRYTWRVRARLGTTAQPYSAPVTATTMASLGDGTGRRRCARRLRCRRRASTRSTPARRSTAAQEAEYTAALDAASPRVRVEELTRTIENRPMNLIDHRLPEAAGHQAGDLRQADLRAQLQRARQRGLRARVVLHVARQLAFTEDPAILAMLSKMTVLLVPSINADGRAHNTRGNTTGQDLNRDHALIEQKETKAFAAMIRDYTPDVMIDNHEGDSEDLPILAARHLNIEQGLFEEGKLMVNEWMYGKAASLGLVDGPVQHRRRQPRGHPAQHRLAQERRQHARRGARPQAAPRGPPRAARNSRPTANARSTRITGRTGRACGTSTPACRRSGPRSRSRSRSRPPTSTGRTILRGVVPVAGGRERRREPERA